MLSGDLWNYVIFFECSFKKVPETQDARYSKYLKGV